MHGFRHAVAAAVVIGALLTSSQIGSDPGAAAETAPTEVAAARSLDDLRPEHRRPTTTTTTAAPAPSTTAAPPPPPSNAAPAPMQAAVAAPAPMPAPAVHAASNGEARALELINDERARASLAPLRLNGGAMSVARGWSGYMASHTLAHNPNLSRDLGGAGVTGWRTIAENVGTGQSVDQIHAMLMGSSGHRANILSGEFSEVGIGVAERNGNIWLTTDFVGW